MHGRVAFAAALVLASVGVWACGDDDDGGSVTPPNDAGPDGKAADVTTDPPKPDAAPPLGKTAGTCGPTIASTRFGTTEPSTLFSAESETASALAMDPDESNLFLTGWTREDPDGGAPMSTTSLLVRKLGAAPTRATTWSKTFNAGHQGLFQAAFARGHAMAVSGDAIIVAGSFAGTLSLGGASSGSIASAFNNNDSGIGEPCTTGVGDCVADAFVASFNRSDGAHRFSVRFGGLEGDTARAVAIAPNGDIVITGTFQGNVSFGATLLTSVGKSDIFVARLDGSTGNAISAFALGGPDDDIGTGVAVDSNNDVIVTGVFQKSITIVPGTTHTSVGADGFVAKLASTGTTLRWSKQVNATRSGQLLAVTVDPASRAVFVAGSFDGSMDFAGTKAQGVRQDEALVAKLDADGNLVWSKQWKGGDEEIASSISLGKDGAVFVAGASNSINGVDYGGGAIGGGLNQGPFFVELDANGGHKCSRSYQGEKGADPPDGSVAIIGANARAVVAAGATSFASAGSFGGKLDLGKGAMTSAGAADGYVVDFTR